MPVFIELIDRTDSPVSIVPQYVTSVVPRSGGGSKVGLVGGLVIEVSEPREEVVGRVEEALTGKRSAPPTPPANEAAPSEIEGG